MKTKKRKVVIVGGGFAGIELVKNLDEKYFEILLIDKLNHHQFQPLFYQVATSQIEPSSISFPLRNIFKNRKNIQIRLAEVLEIKPAQNEIITNIGNFSYDFLILATGCKTNFYGNTEIEKNSFTLKTTYDAIKIRNHIIHAFEKILSATENEKESLLNIVIAGGGPTGVELAGAFAEIKNFILPKDYPGINFSKLNIILVEGSGNTLNNMSEFSKKNSKIYLEKLGVKVLTNSLVKSYDGIEIVLNNSETIKSKTLIWTAGVTGSLTEGLNKEAIAAGNRIIVGRDNRIMGYENIFAVGDIAFMQTPLYPKAHPQVANVAITQAKNLAKNLQNIVLNKSVNQYEYKDLGSMATIGRNKAVVDFPLIKFKGYFAWLVWMFLHLMLILTVRNKLIIFINWAWTYLSKDTSLRLILKENNKK